LDYLIKGEDITVQTKNEQGLVKVQLHPFLISALNGTYGQLHAPPLLHPPEGRRYDADKVLGEI